MRHIILSITTLLLLAVPNFIYSQDKDVNFDQKYIAANDKKTTIEINEVQEMVYLILAITDFGKKNPNMTNQSTEYFQDINKHFSKYTNLPAVTKFDQLLNENLINYFILAGNAYGFKFDGNKIVPTNIYNFPAKGVGKFEVKTNPITTYLKDLEAFAKASQYRKFYKNHQEYYQKLKNDYAKYAAIDQQKTWLESKFDYNINSYRVLTSPLINGMNATHTFEDNNFKEILLFLPTIRNNKEWTETFNQAINTRVIFTEIDHNYVGPVSEKNSERINSIFNNREKWVDSTNKGTAHYPNPVKVYDEYLTWGLFLLYAYDKYGNDESLFQQIVNNVDEMMVKKGFPKGKEFNAELLSLYKNNRTQKVEFFYQPLLDWAAKQ